MVTSVWVRYDNPDMMQQREPLKLGRVSEKILEPLGSEFFGIGYIQCCKADHLPKVLDIRYGNDLIKRDAIENVGVFDRKMFLNYEANDFGYRLRRAGYRIVLATKSRLQHEGGASTIKKSRYFIHYHFYKNKIRFVLKNYGLLTKTFAIAVDFPYFILLMIKYALSSRFDLARAVRDAIVWNISNWRDHNSPLIRPRIIAGNGA